MLCAASLVCVVDGLTLMTTQLPCVLGLVTHLTYCNNLLSWIMQTCKGFVRTSPLGPSLEKKLSSAHSSGFCPFCSTEKHNYPPCSTWQLCFPVCTFSFSRHALCALCDRLPVLKSWSYFVLSPGSSGIGKTDRSTALRPEAAVWSCLRRSDHLTSPQMEPPW
jgi:hypothetical protein